MEGVNRGLRELLEKKKVWYDKQLVLEQEATHQIEVLGFWSLRMGS